MVEPFELAKGQKIDVTPDEVKGTPELIQIKYKNMLQG